MGTPEGEADDTQLLQHVVDRDPLAWLQRGALGLGLRVEQDAQLSHYYIRVMFLQDHGSSRRVPVVRMRWYASKRGETMRSSSSKTTRPRRLRLSELKTHDSLVAKDLKGDRQFRTEWKKSAVARAVALRVLQYRTVHGITQTKLAAQLGLKQSAVARLELGEVTPSFDTLVRLAEGLDIELLIDINPGNRKSKLISAMAERDGVKTSTRDGSRVLVAATS